MARFVATVEGEGIDGTGAALLSWGTLTETNSRGFYVEHSSTGGLTGEGAWHEIGFVETAAPGGTSSTPLSYSFRASDLAYGPHHFRLRQVDFDGTNEIVAEASLVVEMKRRYELQAPYPNPLPAGGAAKVAFAVREKQTVRVAVYDALGRRIQTAFDGEIPASRLVDVNVEADRLASGVYFVRLEGEDFVETKRLVVVR
jgi:hypothetical protein